MKYSEYKYTVLTMNGFYTPRPIALSRIPKGHEGEAYAHIMQYPESIIQYLDKGKKIQDYYSIRYSEYFPIDIDFGSDLSRAHELTLQFIEWMYSEYELDPRWLMIYFSGYKGFHILIPSILFNISPRNDLEKKFKQLARKLIADHPIEKAGAVDLKLYCRNRWFRIPNSINKKSNLYKIHLTMSVLKSFSMEQIQELARQPRSINNVIHTKELSPSPELSRMWQSCLKEPTSYTGIDAGSLLTEGVDKGSRENTAFEITKGLRDQGFTGEEIKYQLTEWNKQNRPPIERGGWPDSQIESTLNYTGSPLGGNSISSLTALLRDHLIFRTHLFSDAEFKCAITLLSLTNTLKKIWNGITILPGQVITSHQSLGDVARPQKVKEPETAARNAIKKLIRAGVLRKLVHLKGNLGILYEWEGEFLEYYQFAAHHSSGPPLQITPAAPVTFSISVNYDDGLKNLITPIDHLIKSSTKNIIHRRN